VESLEVAGAGLKRHSFNAVRTDGANAGSLIRWNPTDAVSASPSEVTRQPTSTSPVLRPTLRHQFDRIRRAGLPLDLDRA